MFCKIPLTNNGVWTCGSGWSPGPRYHWIGTVLPRGVEPVRALLCVTSASLGFVSNTPVQVFNLFGNKRDTFKISMHKTARITSVECQRHH